MIINWAKWFLYFLTFANYKILYKADLESDEHISNFQLKSHYHHPLSLQLYRLQWPIDSMMRG